MLSFTPSSVPELHRFMQSEVAAQHQAVTPFGGKTALRCGHPLRRQATELDLTGLSQVIDYPARDMTITVEAGLRVRELQRLCGLLGIAIAISTIVGLLILIVFGHQLLGLFDASFMSAYSVLLVLAAGYFVDSMAGPNAYLMQMTGLETTYFKIMGTCYAFVLVAQLLLVPIYGGLGAALASACGIVIWNVWAIIVLRKRKGLDPSVFGLLFKPKHGL